MAFKTFAEIPSDVLAGLIPILQREYRLPEAPGDVAAVNFKAGQCSVVQRFVDERDRRVKDAEREAKKNG